MFTPASFIVKNRRLSSDVDLEEKAITINKSVSTVSNTYTVKQGAKTKAGSRVVEIPDFIIFALRQAKASADGLLVLPGDCGLLTNQGYKRLWESYMHYLNICAGGRDKKRTKNEDGKPAFTSALQVIEPVHRAPTLPHLCHHAL